MTLKVQTPPFLSARTILRLCAFIALPLTALFLTGCTNWLDGAQSTLSVDGPVARTQRELFYITCYVTLIIFILVGGALAYATLRFRARKKKEGAGDAHPEQSHGNPMVEIGLIFASVFALAFIAVPTIRAIWYTYDVPADQKANAYEITATGYQWWWKFDYTQEKVTPPGGGEAPLSIANELVIPAGRPVHIELRTADVIHSFWVPKLAGKVDMMPNRANQMWLQADNPGYFYGQCAQFCGDSHAVMRFRVIALEKKEFAEWLALQKKQARNVAPSAEATGKPKVVFASFKTNQFGFSEKWMPEAQTPLLDLWRAKQFPEKDESPELIAKGRSLFLQKTCVSCHTVRGQEGVGVTGPDLTHVGARTTIAGGLLENTPDQLARWISHPERVKPDNKMYALGYMPSHISLKTDEIAALVAYLQSLK